MSKIKLKQHAKTNTISLAELLTVANVSLQQTPAFLFYFITAVDTRLGDYI